MKRRKPQRLPDELTREEKAMTQQMLAYQPPKQGIELKLSELDRRVFCRDNADDVAAAEAERRARERMRAEAAAVTEVYLREREYTAWPFGDHFDDEGLKPKQPKRRGMKVVGGRKKA